MKRKRRPKSAPWAPFERGRPLDITGDPRIDTKEVWLNSHYQVFVYRSQPESFPFPMVHLSIKKHSRDVIHDWRDLQRIKNELCGSRCEAAELYPSAERVTDLANQYHLWVLPPGVWFPFGFNDGRTVSTDPETAQQCKNYYEQLGLKDKSVQRPFALHHGDEDCPAVGPLWMEWVAEQAAKSEGEK